MSTFQFPRNGFVVDDEYHQPCMADPLIDAQVSYVRQNESILGNVLLNVDAGIFNLVVHMFLAIVKNAKQSPTEAVHMQSLGTEEQCR